MSNLSQHQFAALVALISGPKAHKALAAEIGVRVHGLAPIMRALADRGLVKPSGRLNNYTYSLTAAGRLQAEASDDNARIAAPAVFAGSVDELEAKLRGDS